MAQPIGKLNLAWSAVRSGDVLRIFSRNSSMMLTVILVLAVGTLFFRVPTFVISTLVVLNLAVSFIILSTSLYISTPLQLTSYPTVLLLTTLFRLCLSVSVARSILERGDAGDVIRTIGEKSATGNIVVGIVMFLMILVVQFIVVAKGSERVAEVAARFTLDALPGKQMSIDADMRSGLITQDQARAMRSSLQKESQLYGAMDGAMKFVKGDSIATIIIAMINITAGLVIGTMWNNMRLGAAAQKYAILTIGDALVAVISSMMVAVSAGIVVTRVTSEDEHSNVGADISAQLFTNPRSLMVGSGILAVLGLLLFGAASVPLLLVSAGLAVISYRMRRGQEATAREEAELVAKTGAGQDELQPTFVVPLAVVVDASLTHLIDKNTESGARFREELPKLRSTLYYDLGVMLPNVYVRGKAKLLPGQYMIVLKEVPVAYGHVKTDCVYVNDSADNIRVFGLDGEDVRNPADLRPGAWIPASQRTIAKMAELKVWEPADVIMLHLSNIMRRHAHEFVGIQEAQALLDFASRAVPKLVEEVVPKVVTIHQLTDVLQRLVQEGISIRDIKSILDALSEWGRVENKDTILLTEYVRSSLKRYIAFRHTGSRNQLLVHLLDDEIEDVIRGAIRRTSTGSFLSLDSHVVSEILAAFRAELGQLLPGSQKPVVITDMQLRRYVRKMVELEFPALSVLSYQELPPELHIQPIGRITMRPARPQHGFLSPDDDEEGGPVALPPDD